MSLGNTVFDKETDRIRLAAENAALKARCKVLEDALRNFTDAWEVSIPDDGVCKGQLCLWFLPSRPIQGETHYRLAWDSNDYDAVAINSLGFSLDVARAARKALDNG